MQRLLAVLLLLAAPAAAQPFAGGKPVTIIVPFAAGGPTDVVARTLAEPMGRSLGTTVLAENATGAGGTIGALRVVRAPADGTVILLGNIGVATAPSLYRRPAYDPLRDLETIGLVTPVPMLLVGRPDLPVTDLPALMAWVRRPNADPTLGHAGIGSASHLCMTLFRSLMQVPMTAVAYRGTAPIMTEMMAGRLDLTCDQTTNAAPFAADRRIRPFAVTSPARLEALPAIPTTTEGGLPALQLSIWHGLYAPRDTPLPVRERIATALQAALADPVVIRRLAELGTAPEPAERATPAAHRALLEAEIARWRPILQAAGEYAD